MLLSILGFVSYFVVFARFPLTRNFPWANFLLFGAAVLLVVTGLKRAFTGTGSPGGKLVSSVLALLSLSILGAFSFMAIEKPLRVTLRMLRKLTREHTVDADDVRAVLAAGVSREQIEDALAVCFTFNTIDRLADTFELSVPGPKAFEAGAKFLLARGYR